MNIFILNTGRCGSTTWIKACQHISNYTAGHESRIHFIGEERLRYPDNHIEADNRLSWFLGRLERKYGDDAFYVHLKRNRDDTAASFARRMDFGIMKAYREGILLNPPESCDAESIARDYIETVEANITAFLQDKTRKMDARLETIKEDFRAFWDQAGAEGDLDKALSELDIRYNRS
jgi:hypothetical protein